MPTRASVHPRGPRPSSRPARLAEVRGEHGPATSPKRSTSRIDLDGEVADATARNQSEEATAGAEDQAGRRDAQGCGRRSERQIEPGPGTPSHADGPGSAPNRSAPQPDHPRRRSQPANRGEQNAATVAMAPLSRNRFRESRARPAPGRQASRA